MKMLVTIPFVAIEHGIPPRRLSDELIARGIRPAQIVNEMRQYDRSVIEPVCEELQRKIYAGKSGRQEK